MMMRKIFFFLGCFYILIFFLSCYWLFGGCLLDVGWFFDGFWLVFCWFELICFHRRICWFAVKSLWLGIDVVNCCADQCRDSAPVSGVEGRKTIAFKPFLCS